MNLSVRDYQPADFPHVIKIWEATGLGSPERSDDHQTIEKTLGLGGKFLILEDSASKQIIGTAWLTFDGRRFYLHHFGIAPEHQHNGHSHFLMKEVMSLIISKGVQTKLEVHNSNTKAVNLYKKYGFSYLGDYDVYIIRDTNKI
jgi:ribosomal protein S18 acetylase RimI-like enzyme